MFVNIYIWIISKRAGYPIRIQGFKDSSERESLSELRQRYR